MMPDQKPLDYRRIDPAAKVAEGSRPTRIALGLLFGIALTIVFFVVAVLADELGDGDLRAARVLFPYAMILERVTGSVVGVPVLGVAVIQWPAYGAMIGCWRGPRRARWILILVAVHACALMIVIATNGSM